MTLASGWWRTVGRLAVVAAVFVAVMGLSSFTGRAQAAVPSLLAGEQVDGHNSGLNAVSCASASRCVTGGLDLIVQDHGVRTDLTSKLSEDTEEIAAISCAPGSTFCVIGDDTGGVYTLSGLTLSSRSQVTNASARFDAVSCPTTTFCMAIDEAGNVFEFSNGVWSHNTQLPTPTERPSLQMSCPTSQFCMAAVRGSGMAENSYKWTGTTWATLQIENTGAAATALSCTSTIFCIATDTGDVASKYNGLSWTQSSRLTGTSSANDLFYVSCAQTFCLASSFLTSDTLTTTDGTNWTTGTNISLANDGYGSGGPTSCATSTMCAIVDESGNGYTYALPDALTTHPSLTGSATVGSPITLTPGTSSNPDATVIDKFQRCLGGCTTITGTSYTSTASDIGANIEDSETSGVGLDIEDPVSSNTIGPIVAASAPTPSPGGGGTTTAPVANPATIASAKVVGSAAQLVVGCPAGNSASCSVKLVMTVTETLSGNRVIAVAAKKTKTHKSVVTVGSATATISAGGNKTLTLSLNAAGKKLLRTHHTLKVRLSLTAGGKTLATKTLTFKAAKKKHK